MGSLKFLSIQYVGDKYQYESPALRDGLNIIAGDNGTGKTTFCDFVYFLLGGTVTKFKGDAKKRHDEVVGDTNNFVQAKIEISGQRFIIHRDISATEIAVQPEDGLLEIFPVRRTKAKPRTFGDWLLERVGISPSTIFQGTRSWQLGVSDLSRLFYQDQSPDLTRILKSHDQDSPFLDSLEVRRAVFQTGVGKTFNEYHLAYGEHQRLDARFKEVQSKLSALDEALALTGDGGQVPLDHLIDDIDQLDEQIAKLELSRERMLRRPDAPGGAVEELQSLLAELGARERTLAGLTDHLRRLALELFQVSSVASQLAVEIGQIERILFTDAHLGLFSPDTCPYCLSPVDRQEGTCICGTKIDSKRYRHFFYNREEYRAALESKRRNLRTADEAQRAVQKEHDRINAQVGPMEIGVFALRKRISERPKDINSHMNALRFARVEKTLVVLSTRRSALGRQVDIESRRSQLATEVARIADAKGALSERINTLHGAAAAEMKAIVTDFTAIYDRNLRSVLTDVTSAEIDLDTYEPIINRGSYREASSIVPIRLMYFASLLELSRLRPDVAFPRFLLIDTPDTAGIDQKRLLGSIDVLMRIADSEGPSCQVILTTGLDGYSSAAGSDVVSTLTKENKLLKSVVMEKD